MEYGVLSILKFTSMAVVVTPSMERQLQLALDLVRSGVKIRYVTKNSVDVIPEDDEVYIEKYKLDTCPDELQIIGAIQKKIGRTDIFKSQKNTLGICILLLLSKGYCITSSIFQSIDDFFIERCWECIQVVSHNIPKHISEWIVSTMNSRSSSKYSMLFCQSRISLSTTEFLNQSISGSADFDQVDTVDYGMPHTIWHRDDTVRQTMILHLTSANGDLPNDTERS